MLQRMSFQRKLFLSYSIVAAIIIAVSVFAFYRYFVNSSKEQSRNNLEQLAVKTSEQVDMFFKNMDQVAMQVMTNPRVIEIMDGIDERDPAENYFAEQLSVAKEMTRILLSINGPHLATSRVSVYTMQGDYVSFGEIPESTERVTNFLQSDEIGDLYVRLKALRGKRLIVPPREDVWSTKPIRLVSVLRMIKSLPVGTDYGVVEVQQPYDDLGALLNLNSMKAILYSDQGETIAASESTVHELSREEFDRYYRSAASLERGQAFISPVRDSGEAVYVVRSDFTNHLLVFALPKKELFGATGTAVEILLWSGISLMLATLAVTFIISRRLTKPLVQLRKSMKNVSLSNLTVELNQGGGNELLLLNRAFDAMFRRLNDSISQEIKAHALALQSQMHPHFLYNMLAVISSVAEESGNHGIMNMCHRLSRMLRYVSSFEDSEVSLKDEIGHTENYLILMKDRYEHYFSYDIDFDESAAGRVTVPKLIVQPLVENCFQHGFQSVPAPWHIRVSVRVMEFNWELSVTDNGCGFDEQAVRALNENVVRTMSSSTVHMGNLKIGGLGLVNTIVRLKLHYAKEFHFDIQPNLPRGTKITIKGPIK